MICEPHAVVRDIEQEAVPVHLTTVDVQYNRITPSAAYFNSCIPVMAKVQVLTTHSLQAVFPDTVQEFRYGSMIEIFRWCCWVQPQGDINRMTLAGAYFSSIYVKGKTLFVVCINY